MSEPDTSLGVGGPAFPDTHASLFLAPAGLDPTARRARLQALIEQYWRPVYAYVRSTFGKSREDAKDLTQGFFTSLLEDDFLARFDASRGRFRPFLKAALRNFLAKEHREGRAESRGGGRPLLSLDVADLETERFLADLRGSDPEEAFDRQWVREMLARALASLRESLEAEGKGVYFRAYQAYELAAGRPTYGDVARELGISASDVTNHLFYARRKLNDLVAREVSGYSADPAQVADELRELFGQ